METNRKAFRQLSLMMFLTMCTQIIVLLKSSIIASNFGASIEMDAFNFTNTIATFIFSFISTGITTVLIPAIVNKKSSKSINSFITVLYSVVIIVVVIVFMSKGYIFKLFQLRGSKFVEIACGILGITLLTQLLTSFQGISNAIFQCNNKFNFPKVVVLMSNILLFIILLIDNKLSIYRYAIYILFTTFISVFIQLFFVYKDGYRYKVCMDIRSNEYKEMIRTFIPTMFSAGLYQVSLLTDSMISSTLGTGKISILSYSNSIMTMINSMFLANIMTYIYPKIAYSIKDEKDHSHFFNYMIFFNAIMCMMVIGFFVVGKDGISLLYQRGKFTNEISQVVYICVCIYMFGLPINAMRDLFYRYFYAKGDTKSTFKNSIIASIINISISLVLSRTIGLYGVVLGTVVTSIISYVMIFRRFKNMFGIMYSKRKYIIENLKIFIVCGLAILIMFFISNIIIIKVRILRVIIYGILTVVIYIWLLFCFKSVVYKIRL